MKLSDLRQNFPEYRDMSDDELVEAVYESSYSDMKWEDFLEEISDIPEPDKLTPMLDVLVELKNILLSQDRPVDYNDRFGALEIAIKDLSKTMAKVKPPIVNVEAPIVNIPDIKMPKIDVPAPIVNVEAPVVKVPKTAVEFPEQIKEWKFTVVRDRNGYIQDVVAKAI